MPRGGLIVSSILMLIITAVGLPFVLGMFIRDLFKKVNPNLPSLLAAVLVCLMQQFMSYRGDARVATYLPKLMARLPLNLQSSVWVVALVLAVLIAGGILIPFVFARIGVRFMDYINRFIDKYK